MKFRTWNASLAGVLLALGAAFSAGAIAQPSPPPAMAKAYPSRPIGFVVPFSPGTVKSFVPISLVAMGTMSLVVSTNTPAQSVKEFVALAKANPGELNYASSGNGTPQHLTMELFKLDAGVVTPHIPYKGTAPAITDVT